MSWRNGNFVLSSLLLIALLIGPAPPALAAFTANVTSGDAPLVVQFTDGSTDTTAWSWNFGDGSNSTEQDPLHVYDSVGTYTVTLNLTNADGSDTERKTDYIKTRLPSVYTNRKIVFLVLGAEQTCMVKNTVAGMDNIDVYGSHRDNTVEVMYTPFEEGIDLGRYDVIFISRYSGMSFLGANLKGQVDELMENKRDDADVVDWIYGVGTVNHTEHPYITEYWDNEHDKNIDRLITYLSVVDLSRPFSEYNGSIRIEKPWKYPSNGIYHPDAGGEIFEDLAAYLDWYGNDDGAHHLYNPDNYTVGVTFFVSRNGNMCNDVTESIIRELEARGVNVIPVFSPAMLYAEESGQFFKKDGEWAIDAFIDLGKGVWRISSDVKNHEYLVDANVPVINVVVYEGSIEEWGRSATGQDGRFQYQIPIMEIAGQIESIVIGGQVYNEDIKAWEYKPIDYQVDWMIDRTIRWIDLQHLENKDKKVAIIYYSHGKQGALVASNLDVVPSIPNLLDAMNENGYDLGGEQLNRSEFLQLVLQQGRNIGVWAPGELQHMVENYDVEFLPVEGYMEWFNTELDPETRQSVLDTWGAPPGQAMVYENGSGKYFVFPKISTGNILVAPQPTRGTSQNDTLLYHDQTVPPSHQYIAFYLWLNKGYGADAVIHFGRHGTQEWLQGKGVGLSAKECWPAILVQDMPVVYLYDVGGIGEGIMAKRRGNAVMVDHTTPPIINCGLYGNLTLLHDKIHYYQAEGDPALVEEYRRSIINICDDLNFGHEFNVSADDLRNMNDTEFGDFVITGPVHDYLHELASEHMPYGMHILGAQMDDQGLVSMVKSMLGEVFEEHVAAIYHNPHELDAAHSPNILDLLIEDVVINDTSPADAVAGRFNTSGSSTQIIANTTSGANGTYALMDLEDGDYTIYAVKYIDGMGLWMMEQSDIQIEDGQDGLNRDICLTANHTELGYVLDLLGDARLIGDAMISGTVFSNGTRGYKLQADSTVVLRKGTEVLETTTSDSNGDYAFTDLPDGNYTAVAIKYIDAMGFWMIGESRVTIENGQSVESIDIELKVDRNNEVDPILSVLSIASISGTTFSDGRMGLMNQSNSTVVLKQGDTVLKTTISDPNGTYMFTILPDGEYTVVAIKYIDAMGFWMVGETNVTIENAQSVSNIDIGLVVDQDDGVNTILSRLSIASISGTTFSDGKMGLMNQSNSTVVLKQGDTVLKTTISDPNGTYMFTTLPDGEYMVAAIKYIDAMNFWMIGETNVTIENGQSVENIGISLVVDSDDEVDAILSQIRKASVSGKTCLDGQMGQMDQTDTVVVIVQHNPDLSEDEEPVVEDLELAVQYSEAIRGCMVEIPRILMALDGEYIPPALGDDPIRSPEVLPTGNNFYAFNPNIVPTKESWNVGTKMVDSFLDEWVARNGEYPRKVGFVLWSAESMRHKGVMESEIMYLMGVKPVWGSSGKVEGVELIDCNVLGRPRIDTTMTMTGVYRDNWKWLVQLMDRGTRLASQVNDSCVNPNYIKDNSDTIYDVLMATGNYSESDARELSRCRVFGPDEGSWGVGGFTGAMCASGTWDDESKLANLYVNSMSHAYGDEIWGNRDVNVFRQVLSDTDAVLFSRSGNDGRGSGSVVFDHVYEFFGGFGMAVRHTSGDTPEMYIVNLKDPDHAVTETFGEFLSRDLRSKYYNPKWIEGMMQHDYAGASEIDSMFEDFWGLTVTLPDDITDDMWNEMYDVYVQDKYDMGLEEWFDKENPWARQSMNARMLESVRKDYWDASDEIIQDLVKEYAESVVVNGVTCCHHTCGNPLLDGYVQGVMSVPGVVSKDTMDEYNKLMQEATWRETPAVPPTPSETGKKSGEGSTRKAMITDSESSRHPYAYERPAPGESNQTRVSGVGFTPEKPVEPESACDDVSGFVMEPVEETSSMPSVSGMPLMGIVLVLLMLLVIGVGFWRKR